MLNNTRVLISIAIMAIVTYLLRMLPIVVFKKEIKNKFIKSFLAYVPYAVLAAMTFPEILSSTGSFVSAVAGLIVSLILIFLGTSNMLTISISACIAALLVDQIFRIFS